MSILSAWFWLLLALLPLIFLERWVHRHLQGIWLLLFRDPDLALIMYSLLMLPGVIVHAAVVGDSLRGATDSHGGTLSQERLGFAAELLTNLGKYSLLAVAVGRLLRQAGNSK